MTASTQCLKYRIILSLQVKLRLAMMDIDKATMLLFTYLTLFELSMAGFGGLNYNHLYAHAFYQVSKVIQFRQSMVCS